MRVVLHPPGHWERIWADDHRYHALLNKDRTLAEDLEFNRIGHLRAFDRFCERMRCDMAVK